MKLNKKGSFADLIYLSVFLFICAMVITVGWLVQSKINDEWQTKDELGTESKGIMSDATNRYVAIWDGVFLTLLVGLYLGALILAYNVDISPVFFFLSLVVMGVIVLITAVLGNSWYAIATNGEMATYVSNFTIIPYVMQHYVQIFLVMGFGLAGVMYAKTQ